VDKCEVKACFREKYGAGLRWEIKTIAGNGENGSIIK